MPTRHTFGNDGSVVPYCVDATTGQPTAITSVGGAVSVAAAPPTSGGLLIKRILATADTNAAIIKASAGQVFGIEIGNTAAYGVFVKLFNKATLPSAAADTPVMIVHVPAGGRAEVNRPAGVEFATGIGVVAVKGSADLDATVLVAGDIVGSVHYK